MSWLSKVERSLNVVAASIVFILMFLISADALGRYALSKSVTGTIEISEFLMVGSVYLATPYVMAAGKHFTLEVSASLLKNRFYFTLVLLASIASLGMMSIIGWQAVMDTRYSYVIGQFARGLLPFPTWPAKAVFALGIILMSLRLLVGVIRDSTILLSRVKRK